MFSSIWLFFPGGMVSSTKIETYRDAFALLKATKSCPWEKTCCRLSMPTCVNVWPWDLLMVCEYASMIGNCLLKISILVLGKKKGIVIRGRRISESIGIPSSSLLATISRLEMTRITINFIPFVNFFLIERFRRSMTTDPILCLICAEACQRCVEFVEIRLSYNF